MPVNGRRSFTSDPSNTFRAARAISCAYIDPNPSASIDGGPQLFPQPESLSLNSYAGFGEVYYQRPDVKLTGGLRWTDDQKHFVEIPSEVVATAGAIPSPESSISNGGNGLAASSPTGRPNSTSPISRCSTVLIRAAIRAAAPIRPGAGILASVGQRRYSVTPSSADLQAGIRGCL